LGLINPDELCDLTDEEIKEVLLEPLQLLGRGTPLHIARILKKALNHHRSSALTDHMDVDEPVSSTNSVLNNPVNGTITLDGVSTTITDLDFDLTSNLDLDLDVVQAVVTPQPGIK
jgi:hypothetical protein